ncbi:hypothetical protein M0638_27605 [Roseomonas sp. NAR14]|uniref:Uncharacterized protein n=1 Tax=Roseomonas acroporae TaxID=2937791 RepID=A0A9X2BY88_9PROT|nr:hypothetical protein [Roseomonas acroporae]MCK8788126.1 hypothetical protein [Roseomonas acroporae]
MADEQSMPAGREERAFWLWQHYRAITQGCPADPWVLLVDVLDPYLAAPAAAPAPDAMAAAVKAWEATAPDEGGLTKLGQAALANGIAAYLAAAPAPDVRAAALEEAARACEEYADRIRYGRPWLLVSGERSNGAQGALECAEQIRALRDQHPPADAPRSP